MLVVGFLFVWCDDSRADTGDTVPCQEEDRSQGASLVDVASSLRFLLEECGEGSDIARRATIRGTPEELLILGFNADGALVSGEELRFNGLPWCCDGGSSYTLRAGLVEPTCANPVEHEQVQVQTQSRIWMGVRTMRRLGADAVAGGRWEARSVAASR